MIVNRLLPELDILSRIDRRLLSLLGGAGRIVAGRLIWDGLIRK